MQREMAGLQLLAVGIEIEFEAVDGVHFWEARRHEPAFDRALDAALFLLVAEPMGHIHRREVLLRRFGEDFGTHPKHPRQPEPAQLLCPPPVTGEPDSGSVISADLKKYYAKLAQRCSGTYDVDPLSASVLVTAQTEYAAGKDDIALSASGCTRLLVQRKDEQIISETIVGPPFVNDPIQPGFPHQACSGAPRSPSRRVL